MTDRQRKRLDALQADNERRMDEQIAYHRKVRRTIKKLSKSR